MVPDPAWTQRVASLTAGDVDLLPRYFHLLKASGLLRDLSVPHHSDMRPFDFTLSTSASNLGQVMKRSLLVSDRLILVQRADGIQRPLDSYGEAGDRKPEVFETLSKWELGVEADVTELTLFLKTILPLLKRGEMVFVPPFLETTMTTGYRPHRTSMPPMGMPIRLVQPVKIDDVLEVALDRASIIAGPAPELWKSVARHVLSIEIPVIEGISLQDYVSVLENDDSDVYCAARRRMQRCLMGITSQSPHDPYLPKRVEGEVADSLREMRARSASTVRTAAVQTTGAGLATIMASLVAVGGVDLAPYIAALGVGGGAFGTIESVRSWLRERKSLERDAYYFFWLLEQRSRRF